MAIGYSTGTATDYKDLMLKTVDLAVRDSGLVADSQQWFPERCTWIQHNDAAPEFYFGAVNKAGTVSGFFNGQLDEIAIYHTELSAAIITTHNGLISAGNGANYFTAVSVTDNAYNYWRLDEASGTTATDSQANNNATYNGTFTYSATGIFGAGGGSANNNAVTLDGSTAYLTTSTAGTQAGDAAYTIETHFKTSNDGVVMSVKNGNDWYALEIVSGDLVFKNSHFQNEGQITVKSTVSDGSYHYLVFVKDANRLFKVYYDGTLVYTYTEPDREFVLKGQGNGGLDEIYVGAKIDFDVTEDYYNWLLQGYSGFIRTQDFDVQPMAITADEFQPALLLWNTSITYHIFATGRRIIVMAQVSGNYEAAYLGLLKGYNFPNTNPYPLIVAGSSIYATDNSGRRYSSTSDYHANFWNVIDDYSISTESGSKCNFGEWKSIINKKLSITNQFVTYPWTTKAVQEDRVRFPETIILLTPGELIDLDTSSTYTGKRVVGAFEGCYFTSSGGIADTDTITIGTNVYVVFTNVFRAGREHIIAIQKAE